MSKDLSPSLSNENYDASCAALIRKNLAMYDLPSNSLLPILFLLASCSASQNISAFCNRIFHSIIVANGMLYVDGGELRTVLPPMYFMTLSEVG